MYKIMTLYWCREKINISYVGLNFFLKLTIAHKPQIINFKSKNDIKSYGNVKIKITDIIRNRTE